jgi:amino acid transporter
MTCTERWYRQDWNQFLPLQSLMKTSIQSLTKTVVVGAMTSFVYASTALAQNGFAGPDPNLAGLPEATGPQGVRNVITNILAAVLNFLALIAVVVIVIAGIRLIVSQGEDEAKDKAKKTIFYALAGLVIVLFARVIVSLVTVYLANQV